MHEPTRPDRINPVTSRAETPSPELALADREIYGLLLSGLDDGRVRLKLSDYTRLASIPDELAEWVRSDLDHADPFQRAESLAALALMQGRARAALPAMVPAVFSDPNPAVAVRGSLALLQIVKGAPNESVPELGTVVPELLHAATLEGPRLRLAAYILLSYSKDASDQSLDAFVRGIVDPEEEIQNVAHAALRSTGFVPEAAVPHLIGDADDELSSQALAAIGAICKTERAIPSIPGLFEKLRDASESVDPEKRTLALCALARATPKEEELPKIFSRSLGDPDEDVRLGALMTIPELAPRAASPAAFVAPLLEALSESPIQLRVFYIDALCACLNHAITVDQPPEGLEKFLEVLYPLTRSGSPEEREVGLLSFALMRVKALDALPDIGRCLSHEDAGTRLDAHIAAFRLGEEGAPLARTLKHSIDDPNEQVAALAIRALASHKPDPGDFVPRLWDAYFGRGEAVKAAVILALGQLEHGGKTVALLMKDALSSDSTQLKRFALSSLPSTGIRGRGVQPLVEKLLHDPDREVAELARELCERYFGQA